MCLFRRLSDIHGCQDSLPAHGGHDFGEFLPTVGSFSASLPPWQPQAAEKLPKGIAEPHSTIATK